MLEGNLFSNLPSDSREELCEVLAKSGNIRIERIVSAGHSSPEGFWYDQDRDEWVVLIEGSAALRFEGEDRDRVLAPGDWVEIRAHVRHRVEWTDARRQTVWLAVFY
ncbi:MAG: cupin domain-containing protein [Desulfobacteraceae bacterium]|nr:cupin domain-containing protein [Desulfobacteraceae bacterium]